MKKLELLNQKFEELKHLFATEQLDKLKTLTFVFDTPKKGKKNKRKTEPKTITESYEIETVEEQIEGEVVVNTVE